MDGDLRLWSTTGPAKNRRSQLEELGLPLQRILQAADQEQRAAILAALRAQADTVLECLMPMLRHSAQALPTDARRAAGLDALARDCADRLRTTAACRGRLVDRLDRLRLRTVRDPGDVLWFPLAASPRMAAGEGRTSARAHQDRLSRAPGTPPDQTAGMPVHPRTDQDRAAVHPRADRLPPSRSRPDLADLDLERPPRRAVLSPWDAVGECDESSAVALKRDRRLVSLCTTQRYTGRFLRPCAGQDHTVCRSAGSLGQWPFSARQARARPPC